MNAREPRGWRAIALLAGLLSVAPLHAQQAPPESAPVISAERLMATVRTLASEPFQGRASGTEGNAKARALIQARFDEMHLQPNLVHLPGTHVVPHERGDGGPLARDTR